MRRIIICWSGVCPTSTRSGFRKRGMKSSALGMSGICGRERGWRKFVLGMASCATRGKSIWERCVLRRVIGQSLRAGIGASTGGHGSPWFSRSRSRSPFVDCRGSTAFCAATSLPRGSTGKRGAVSVSSRQTLICGCGLLSGRKRGGRTRLTIGQLRGNRFDFLRVLHGFACSFEQVQIVEEILCITPRGFLRAVRLRC